MGDAFSEDDLVCAGCIEDEGLKAVIKADGVAGKCGLCGQSGQPAVSIARLATIMLPLIEKFYVKVSDEYGQAQGDDLSWVIQDVLGGQCLECEPCLSDALVHADYPDHNDPESPFIDVTASYRNRSVNLAEMNERWEGIKNTLKHVRRYFNSDALDFFEWLFEDLEHLTSPPEGETWPPPPHVPVVWTLPLGTIIYRGRVCDTGEALKAFLADPSKEVGPPRPDAATAGRMNPDGIPVFYGALDAKTCVAELRPPIGRRVLVAAFTTVTPIRVLDFRRLESSYGGKKQLSYFDPDASEQFERREFLRAIHDLISEPVLPERENEYLVTQFLAEYLSHVRKPKVEAVLFRSTQRKSGTNVALFPGSVAVDADVDSSKALRDSFGVAYVNDSAQLFRATEVEYTVKKEGFVITEDGHAVSYSLDEDL